MADLMLSEHQIFTIRLLYSKGKQDSDEDSNNLKIDERKEEKETASSAGKQDSEEDSNNLKIDERKEEKETASSAGEEKFPDQTENTNYPKANLLFEGGAGFSPYYRRITTSKKKNNVNKSLKW
ncbi:uncharacterized protein LOC136034415 isoform X1 [Artemia franciscana]|uniref:uncharacterized protein LOC136034415 isoform X1 n=1 Tax=Artemia franciscana TaxID=6661 RepID=UPI0032DB0854